MKVLYKMKYSHKCLNVSLWLKPFYFLICNRNVLLLLTVMTEPSLSALLGSFTVESLGDQLEGTSFLAPFCTYHSGP